MKKISINLLAWNHSPELVKKCIDAVLAQSYKDFDLYFSDNGSNNDIVAFVTKNYGQLSNVKIIDNGLNLGYAGGHNKFFCDVDSELLMVLNPDAILQNNFLENIVPVFNDHAVAAATGKMLRPERDAAGNWVIDGTGIIIEKSRRARERGQLEEDLGQYDLEPNVFGVSGTAAVYRKSALEAVKLPFPDALPGYATGEYFDNDFVAYWEDLDLSWRLRLAGFECRYVSCAVVYHQRVAGASRGGYKDIAEFIKHHKKLSPRVRQFNWRNHLFAIIKNDFGDNLLVGLPFILARELAMFGYILLFEAGTLKVLPDFFRLLPKMFKKRAIIQQRRKITSDQIAVWFK